MKNRLEQKLSSLLLFVLQDSCVPSHSSHPLGPTMVKLTVLEQHEEVQITQIKPSHVVASSPSTAAEDPAVGCGDDLMMGQTDDRNPVDSQPQLDQSEDPASSPVWAYNKPLAFSPSTPWLARWLIPLLCVATHALFLYGQIEPMWRLTQSQSVDLWYNATSTTAQWAYDTLGLPTQLNIVRNSNSTIQTFTYSFAIKELWQAKGMPGLFLPRLAAILLALFSGLWPHVKLLLLNLTWIFMSHPTRRTRTLVWLSCLGKWSLADILVVCVMVGVLHIDWVVDPDAIRIGIAQNLPQLLALIQSQYSGTELCTVLLHTNCTKPDSISHRLKCDACSSAVNTAYWKPEWAQSTGKAILNGIETSGGGICELRVIGMRGIYAFCGAVVFSILLSLVVDILDHRAKRATEAAEYLLLTAVEETRLEEGEQEPLMRQNIEVTSQDLDEDEENPSTSYSLLEENQPQQVGQYSDEPQETLSYMNVETAVDEETAIRVSIRWCSCSHAFFSFLVLILATFACTWITLERQVHGAVPQLLHDILGIIWHKAYSLHTLSRTIGAAGGWDYMLMATFSLFIVFGPLLRSSLCVLGHILPGRLSTIQTFVDLIGAFCAWEVLVIAVTMIYLLMPTITNTILMDDRCQQVDPSGRCFQVDFNVLRTSILVLVSGVMLVLISNSFSFFDRRRDRVTTMQRRAHLPSYP
jgi:hypothetical protein